jgi:hypothetical protein
VDTFLPSGKVSVREGLDLLISIGNF